MFDELIAQLKANQTPVERMKDLFTPFGWGRLISKNKPSGNSCSSKLKRGSKGKIKKW